MTNESSRRYRPVYLEVGDHPLDGRFRRVFGVHRVTFVRTTPEEVLVRAADVGGGRWCRRCWELDGLILQTKVRSKIRLYELAKQAIDK